MRPSCCNLINVVATASKQLFTFYYEATSCLRSFVGFVLHAAHRMRLLRTLLLVKRLVNNQSNTGLI